MLVSTDSTDSEHCAAMITNYCHKQYKRVYAVVCWHQIYFPVLGSKILYLIANFCTFS